MSSGHQHRASEHWGGPKDRTSGPQVSPKIAQLGLKCNFILLPLFQCSLERVKKNERKKKEEGKEEEKKKPCL